MRLEYERKKIKKEKKMEKLKKVIKNYLWKIELWFYKRSFMYVWGKSRMRKIEKCKGNLLECDYQLSIKDRLYVWLSYIKRVLVLFFFSYALYILSFKKVSLLWYAKFTLLIVAFFLTLRVTFLYVSTIIQTIIAIRAAVKKRKEMKENKKELYGINQIMEKLSLEEKIRLRMKWEAQTRAENMAVEFGDYDNEFTKALRRKFYRYGIVSDFLEYISDLFSGTPSVFLFIYLATVDFKLSIVLWVITFARIYAIVEKCIVFDVIIFVDSFYTTEDILYSFSEISGEEVKMSERISVYMEALKNGIYFAIVLMISNLIVYKTRFVLDFLHLSFEQFIIAQALFILFYSAVLILGFFLHGIVSDICIDFMMRLTDEFVKKEIKKLEEKYSECEEAKKEQN